MTERLQIYKCVVCGNIVEVLHADDGVLVCHDKPMKLFTENTVDAAKEKHVPVKEKTDKGILVKVGSVPHPMEEEHYIEWIQVIDGDRFCRQFLKPGQKPEALFECADDTATAREYCNIHGLWKAADSKP